MPYLKHEMRQLFEKHSSMAFYDNNSRFEEGLLEKIMNLAFAGLSIYSSKHWEITAVGSPVLLQKLYRASGEKIVIESAYTLVVFDCNQTVYDMTVSAGISTKTSEDDDKGTPTAGMCSRDPGIIKRHWNKRHEIDLLSLSIGYAAKFYCVDCFTIKDFDGHSVARELNASNLHKVAAMICLGFFRERDVKTIPAAKNLFSETVKIIL